MYYICTKEADYYDIIFLLIQEECPFDFTFPTESNQKGNCDRRRTNIAVRYKFLSNADCVWQFFFGFYITMYKALNDL